MRKDNTNSLYSIILSTYQSDLYLNAALESLYNQSYQNFELVLINDNSNDNTEKILDYWKNKFNNFVYIKNKENLGLTKSLNIGIYKSKGKFIVRHDSDDISHPSRLAIQDLFLKAYPKINLLFAKEIRINKMGEVIKVSFIKKIIRKIKRLIILRDLWLYNSVSHGVVSFQRENKGKLILVGVPRKGNNINIFSLPLHFGKTITGSHGGEINPTIDIPRYLSLFDQNIAQYKKLITERFPLDQINDAIEYMKAGKTAGRILIEMR